MKRLRKAVALLLAMAMVFAMGVTAFAAEPSTCKFTKTDGSDLKMGMSTGLIESCDLSDSGIATVKFKSFSLLGYKGTIVDMQGAAVKWDETTSTAVIDMNQAQSKETGVPLKIEFQFSLNLTPPGMSNQMDAMFVCY